MDGAKRYPGQVISFSDHLAARGYQDHHRHILSREDVYIQSPDMEPFRNEIPLTDYDSHQPDWPLKPDSYVISSYDDGKLRCRKALVQKLILPTALITVPMTLLAACLLGLVFGYRVRSDESLFDFPDDGNDLKDHTYILVNFSASRILFVASWASTFATLLGGFIMSLWTYKIAQKIRNASVDGRRTELPTAYQLSLLIGLELASMDRLRRFVSYSFKYHQRIPPVLKQAAMVLSLASLLSIAVVVGDTVLHYTTSTVSFDQIFVSNQHSELGRGLTEECLTMNRMENGGLPCSVDNILAAKNYTQYTAYVNEAAFLASNTSKQSEIWILPQQPLARGDVATLIPQTTTLSPFVDYRASTIGVATQCTLISERCNFTAEGPEDYYSHFNCSPNFWGTLGMAPVLSTLAAQIQDPNVSPLAFKTSPNLQYSFFSDPSLDVVYNTVGYNLTTGLGSAEIPAIPDDQLVNPVYVGIAARFSLQSQLAGVDLTTQPGIFKGPSDFIDFVLNCAYETYEVDYVWANNTVQDAIFSPTKNGSLAEIFHGANLPLSVDGSDYDYQAFLVEAALQPTTEALAQKWADLYSMKVLSVVGAFTSGRASFEEQNRVPLLVAKVPKVALSVLVGSCLAFTVLGTWLFCIALSAGTATDIRDLVGRLSLPGISMYAFGEDTLANNNRRATGRDNIFDETSIQEETGRVGVFGGPEMGYDYKVV